MDELIVHHIHYSSKDFTPEVQELLGRKLLNKVLHIGDEALDAIVTERLLTKKHGPPHRRMEVNEADKFMATTSKFEANFGGIRADPNE